MSKHNMYSCDNDKERKGVNNVVWKILGDRCTGTKWISCIIDQIHTLAQYKRVMITVHTCNYNVMLDCIHVFNMHMVFKGVLSVCGRQG